MVSRIFTPSEQVPLVKNIKRPLYEILIEHTGFPTCDIDSQNFSDVVFPPPHFTARAIKVPTTFISCIGPYFLISKAEYEGYIPLKSKFIIPTLYKYRGEANDYLWISCVLLFIAIWMILLNTRNPKLFLSI